MEDNQEENCLRMLPRYIMEENQDDKYALPPLAEGPWLMATHDNQKWNKLEKQTFRTNINSYIKTIPELDRNIIVAAHQDWLILRDREDCTIYSLWNPVTSQFLQLPELPLEDDIQPLVCLLTSSLDLVNNPETCLLVLFFYGGLMFSCTPTTSQYCSWVKQCNEVDGSVFEIKRAATVEGVIYAYGCTCSTPDDDDDTLGYDSYKLVCVKNVNNGSSSSLTMEPMNIEEPGTKTVGVGFMDLHSINYMVECCEVLYYIAIMARIDGDNYNSLDIVKVGIWKFDFSHMDWIQVESLSNRAFLLGTSCTWCWASPTSLAGGAFIEENCIYLAQRDDDKVYSYNLSDDSCTILLPHPSFLESFYGPTWFMPMTYQRLLSGSEGNQLINETSEQSDDDDINKEFQEQVEDTEEVAILGTLLSELPLDILQSIAKRVNLFDYMNLRLTCKRFYEVNPISQWRSNCRYPLFMFPKGRNGTYELLDPFENISRPILIPHTSPNVLSSIEYCKDGWLLVQSEELSLRYMYPFTFAPETWKYPSCEPAARFGFSTCPTSPNSLAVAISELVGTNFFCFEASNGEWEYYDTEFEPDNKDLDFRPNSKTGPIYHNNAFYFLGRNNGCLGEFRFIPGEATWHVYKHPFTDEDKDTLFDSCYLVEVDGEIVSVFIKIGRYLKVFKFDISNECWIELDTLGDYILFLSAASSHSLKADKSEMANRIYLPRRLGNGIVFYSLDTRTYHTPGSADSRQDLSGTKAQSSCCWLW